jgi:hypothetical protein
MIIRNTPQVELCINCNLIILKITTYMNELSSLIRIFAFRNLH